MKVVGHDRKKFIWEVVNDYVVEEPTDHDEIGLQGFDLKNFDKEKKGAGREGSSKFPYLLILINLWPGDWKTQLNSMNHKV